VVQVINAYKVSDKNTALSLNVVSKTVQCKPSDSDLGTAVGVVKLM
jgi:hypothetical protein